MANTWDLCDSFAPPEFDFDFKVLLLFAAVGLGRDAKVIKTIVYT